MADEKKNDYMFEVDPDKMIDGATRTGPFNLSAVAAEFVVEWVGERVHWRGHFYKYDGSRWVQEDDGDVMRDINQELMTSVYWKKDKESGKDKLLLWQPHISNAALTNIQTQIQYQCGLPSTREPVRSDETRLFLTEGRWSVTEREPLPSDPTEFNLHAIQAVYDPDAQCPEYDAYVKNMFGGDEDSIEIHDRWGAAEITGYTKMQKGYYLLGQKRSGKGTAFKIFNALLGPGQTTPASLYDLSTDFGLENAVGKSAIRVHDARDLPKREMARATQRLLSLIGGDEQQINIKREKQWTGDLGALVTIDSNDPLAFVDSSGTAPSRFIINMTVGTHWGSEDYGLAERIIEQERAGILNRLLRYVDRLDDVWPVNARSIEVMEDMKEAASPVASWMVDAEVAVGLGLSMPCSEAFDSYRTWAAMNDQGRPHAGWFGKELRSVVLARGVDLRKAQPVVDGKQVRTYEGIGFL